MRLQHALGRAEVLEQRALARRADAGQLVEDRWRSARSRRVRWWVIAKRWASSRTRCSSCSSGVSWASTIGSRRPGDEDLLDALGQRDDRHAALAEAVERAQARRELARAAVDDDEVRQRGERLVALGVVRAEVLLGLPLREPPAEHLLHRGEVVGHALLMPRTLKRR